MLMKYMLTIVLSVQLFLFTQYSIAQLSSSYDVANGELSIPCVDILINGQAAGEGGTRQTFSLSMSLADGRLSAANLAEITTSDSCSASFDSATGIYRDTVDVSGDSVELTLTYSGGVEFVPSSVFFQRDFITADLNAPPGVTTALPLPTEIDFDSAVLSLNDGSAVPDFVSLTDNEIRVSPTATDSGAYSLRIEWGDQVEFLNLTVENSSASIELTQLPDSLPQFSAISLYSDDSIFNTPISENAAIDPNSQTYIEGLNISEQFVIQVGQYSSTVFFAGVTTPLSDIALPCGEFWELGISEIINAPIPDWAVPSNDVDGSAEPPIGCGEESAQDNFMVILDIDNRCEYDLWQARREDNQWVASFATAFDMDGTGVHPNGLSSRGSGFAFLGGVIWPSELAAGEIKHPLSFSYEFPKSGGPVAPATDSDGVSTENFALPEGARLQLDPDFDLNTLDLTDHEHTIAKAMQEYGLILVDRGGGGPVGLYAVDPSSSVNNDYLDSWGDEDFIALDNLQIADLPFRVLLLPPQDENYRDSLSLADNRCISYQ